MTKGRSFEETLAKELEDKEFADAYLADAKENQMGDDEIMKILALINKAYENSGEKVVLATLMEGEETKILQDDRDLEEIN